MKKLISTIDHRDDHRAVFSLDKEHFNFETIELFRDEGRVAVLPAAQKNVIKVLCSWKEGGDPVFRSIKFHQNYIIILLFRPWDHSKMIVARDAIKASWPNLF